MRDARSTRGIGGYGAILIALVSVSFATLPTSPTEARCQVFQGYGGSASYAAGNIFEVTAINDLIIRRLSVFARGVGTTLVEFEVWVNDTTAQPGDPNWQLAGSAEIPWTAGMLEIPVDIDLYVAANQTVGLCVVNVSTANIFTCAAAPVGVLRDANLEMDGANSWAGSYDPQQSPPVDATYTPHGFYGQLIYEPIEDPEIEVTFNGWSLGCNGSRPVDVGNVADSGVSVFDFEVSNLGATRDLVLAPPFAATVRAGSFSQSPTATLGGPATIAPQANETLAIAFQPNVGPFEFEVVLPNNDASEPTFTITVTGVGVPAPKLSLDVDGQFVADGAQHDLGDTLIDVPEDLPLLVANVGTAGLTLGPAPIFHVDVHAGTFEATPAVAYAGPTSLAANGSESASVSFQLLDPGPFAFDITVASDDPISPSYRISIVGDAFSIGLQVECEGVSVDHEGDVDLGRVAINRTRNVDVRLESTGSAALLLGPDPIFTVTVEEGAYASEPTFHYGGTLSIDGGTSQEGVLAFRLGSVAAFRFTVAIASNDPQRQPYVFTVFGDGGLGGDLDGADKSCGARPSRSGQPWPALVLLLALAFGVGRARGAALRKWTRRV